MRVENITTKPRNSGYLKTVLAVLGAVAVSAGTYVAWPALTYLGEKLV